MSCQSQLNATWLTPSSGMSSRMALVKTDVSEERAASIIKGTRIGALRMLAVSSNGRTATKKYVIPKRRILQVLHGVTSQKTAIFIATAVKTSNLTQCSKFWEGDLNAASCLIILHSQHDIYLNHMSPPPPSRYLVAAVTRFLLPDEP
jgi:hypothetical protein